ncbi:hypothetical protein STEG23_020190, partial [Scotinomys teguina]
FSSGFWKSLSTSSRAIFPSYVRENSWKHGKGNGLRASLYWVQILQGLNPPRSSPADGQ